MLHSLIAMEKFVKNVVEIAIVVLMNSLIVRPVFGNRFSFSVIVCTLTRINQHFVRLLKIISRPIKTYFH